MEFQLGTCVPLIVSHLKKVDLWYRARDIHQRIDPAEAIKRDLD